MTDSGTKFKIFKFLKIILSSLLITALLLFTIASIRTLSLDVNVGLKLARWEKTSNISLVIDDPQREQLLAHFKGNLSFACSSVKFNGRSSMHSVDGGREGTPLTSVICVCVQRLSGSPRCPFRGRRATPPRCLSLTASSGKVTLN